MSHNMDEQQQRPLVDRAQRFMLFYFLLQLGVKAATTAFLETRLL